MRKLESLRPALAAVLILGTALPLGAAHAEPVRLAPEQIGQDGRVTLSPGFAPDGSFMVFAQSECSPIWECPQRLKISRRTEDGWSAPRTVARTARGRADWPSVAPDGRTVLFSWAVPRDRHEDQGVYEDFDLYRMDLADRDAAPVPIDAPDINRIRGGKFAKTRFVNNETAPVLTQDGDLYFWTERLDGPGERDIYVARADGRSGFEAPRPVPAPINSARREDSAWVSPDGRLMLLSVDGRGVGEGGGDVFVSRATDNGWSEPVPLGPAVNSPWADFAARITPDGEDLVFTSTRPVGDEEPGLLQVWTVPVAEVPALAAP